VADGKKIFIADDDPHFCDIYRMALGAEGFQVQFAYNGREAFEKIVKEKPDMIILDVTMPEMDGYEVCSKLRELPQFAFTPIIMLTGRSADEDKIKGYSVGADEYLTKPFSLKVLKARVQGILEKVVTKKAETTPTASQPAPSTSQPTRSVFQATQSVFQAAPSAAQPSPAPAPTTKPAPQPTQTTQPIDLKLQDAVGAAPAARPKPAMAGKDPVLDLFGGPIPPGSNILVVGPLGSGKSFFSRLFLAQGLLNSEKCMFICLDDDPSSVRKDLSSRYQLDTAGCEQQSQIRFVDAYSWNGGKINPEEKFAITGALELADLSALISEAGAELGQNDRMKQGGRRVVDSISSLFLSFDLSYVQRFIAHLARSGHFAEATTIFVVEQGAGEEQALNNIKYVMDGVLEFKSEEQRFLGRVQTMKWAVPKPQWTDVTRT